MFQTHFPKLKVPVIPVLIRPDETYANDSTPLILELDMKYSQRRIIPANAGQAFLSALVEDFADEWMTKIMFEGRFHTKEDAKFGAKWQFWQGAAESGMIKMGTPAQLDSAAEYFGKRQVGRRQRIVGNDWAPMEKTLRRVCEIIESSISVGNPFLFGQQPTVADFGLFGQMRQLIMDPFPARVMYEYPTAWAWVWKMDDLSGYDASEDSLCAPNKASDAVLDILKLMSKTYIPFLLANADAVKMGSKSVALTIFDGEFKHKQPPFKYQAWCLDQLLLRYQALTGADLKYVNEVLQVTGCLSLVATVMATPASKL